MVEVWILATVFDSELRTEMELNVLHTYRSFGLAEADYERARDELLAYKDTAKASVRRPGKQKMVRRHAARRPRQAGAASEAV